LKTHEIHKTALRDNAIRITVFFHDSDMGKYWLKILRIAVNLPQPTLTKTWRKFAKSSPKTDKLAFC
jgi:hypothetical protein